MNNYQTKIMDDLLKDITIRCKECESKMMPLYLGENHIGWVCRDDYNVHCSRSFVFELWRPATISCNHLP